LRARTLLAGVARRRDSRRYQGLLHARLRNVEGGWMIRQRVGLFLLRPLLEREASNAHANFDCAGKSDPYRYEYWLGRIEAVERVLKGQVA